MSGGWRRCGEQRKRARQSPGPARLQASGGLAGSSRPLDAGEAFALGGYVPAKVAEVGPHVVNLAPEVVYPIPENPPEKQG